MKTLVFAIAAVIVSGSMPLNNKKASRSVFSHKKHLVRILGDEYAVFL